MSEQKRVSETDLYDMVYRILHDLNGPSKFGFIDTVTGKVFYICRYCDARRRREENADCVILCPNCAERWLQLWPNREKPMFNLWAWLVNRKPFSWAYDLAFAIIARLRRRQP